MEVRSLLSQAMLEMSGCKSKNLTLRRPKPVVIPMSPPQKTEELLHPVDTSSQVSAKVAEASLVGIPISILPIAAASRAGSITSPGGCNGASGKCQQTPWGSVDHQSIHRHLQVESCLGTGCGTSSEQVPSSQIHQRSQSCVLLCNFWCPDHMFLVNPRCQDQLLSGDPGCQGHLLSGSQGCLRQPEATSCKRPKLFDPQPSGISKALRASQAKTLQRENGNIMCDLEKQVIWEESRSQANFLSACQATLYTSPPELRSA